jgi:hypothetical protein
MSLGAMSSDPATQSRTPRSKRKGRRDEQPETPSSVDASPAASDAPRGRELVNPLLGSFLALFVIGFGVWLVSATKSYREEYAQATEGWRVGSSRVVELTVIKEDATNLACASDQEFAGVRCGYRRDKREAGSVSPDNRQMLQPYNTVNNELLLGAGLWSSPALKGPLPGSRFSVICNYNIKGVVKTVAIRFNPKATFAPVGKTVTAGTFSECQLPK